MMPHSTLPLGCPKCHQALPVDSGPMECPACGLRYGKNGAVYDFICRELYPSRDQYERTRAIIEFWGSGWEKRMAENDCSFLYRLSRDGLEEYLADFGSFHADNNFLLGNEVDLGGLKGKVSLNIGCGAGDESAFLAYHGSLCIGLDVTSQAARAACQLMDTLGAQGMGIQGDSRFLPLPDDSVDLVYSSGVLHHSPSIDRSVSEIRRVLKPGGSAYIMLYATCSLMFLQPRLIGLLKGHVSRTAQLEYMSRDSEKDWETDERTNPYTETFTARRCRELFLGFRKVSVRKGSFDLNQIRILGRFFKNGWLNSIAKRLMERRLGACLFIRAEK